MKVIDLSHLVTNGMPVFPGTPSLHLKPVASIESDGFNELQINITTHTGTHIDCPLHIIEKGFDTTADIGNFYGKGIMIDCSTVGNFISLPFLKIHEEFLNDTAFVLFYTGWDQYWGKSAYFGSFPVLSAEAAEYIAKFRLKGAGIDAPSFDPMDSTALPVHNLFLARGFILIENLTHLNNLPHKDFRFSCLPLKIENGDGCPVRAAGIID